MDGSPHGPGGGRSSCGTATSSGDVRRRPADTATCGTYPAVTAAHRPLSSCLCSSQSRSAARARTRAAVWMPCHLAECTQPCAAGDHGSATLADGERYGTPLPSAGELATAGSLRPSPSVVDFRARHEALGEAGRPEDGVCGRVREDAGNPRLLRPLVHLWCTCRLQIAHV